MRPGAGQILVDFFLLFSGVLQPVLRVLQVFFIPVIFDQIQIHVDKLHLVALGKIDLCLLALILQRADLTLQLAQDIIDTDQIRLLAVELLNGSLLAMLVLDDSGSLIKKLPALIRLSVEDLFHLSLSDQGIPFFSDTGIKEQLLDIPHSDGGSVDQVFRFTGPVQTPCDRYLLVVNRKRVIRIVQRDRDISIAHRPALHRAGKDHILHGSAAQLLCRLLTQNPPDRIGYI